MEGWAVVWDAIGVHQIITAPVSGMNPDETRGANLIGILLWSLFKQDHVCTCMLYKYTYIWNSWKLTKSINWDWCLIITTIIINFIYQEVHPCQIWRL